MTPKVVIWHRIRTFGRVRPKVMSGAAWISGHHPEQARGDESVPKVTLSPVPAESDEWAGLNHPRWPADDLLVPKVTRRHAA